MPLSHINRNKKVMMLKIEYNQTETEHTQNMKQAEGSDQLIWRLHWLNCRRISRSGRRGLCGSDYCM